MSGAMARGALLAYLLAAFSFAAVSDPVWLGAGLAGALAASGRSRWRLLQRSLRGLLPFALTLSVAYGGFAQWQERPWAHWLQVANLRALLLVYLGCWAVSRIDLLRALAPWPLAAMVVALALAQITTVKRLLDDFRHAFISRHPARPGHTARNRHALAQASTLLDKSVAASAEATQALRSRGALEP